MRPLPVRVLVTLLGATGGCRRSRAADLRLERSPTSETFLLPRPTKGIRVSTAESSLGVMARSTCLLAAGWGRFHKIQLAYEGKSCGSTTMAPFRTTTRSWPTRAIDRKSTPLDIAIRWVSSCTPRANALQISFSGHLVHSGWRGVHTSDPKSIRA